MNKTTTTIIKKPKTKSKAKTTIKIRRTRKRFRISRIPRIRRRRRRRFMPVASVKSFKRMFNISSQDGNSMTVKGRDLVYSIPETLTQNEDTNVITVIPCNPCYWIGTRVAALAAGYQNYRPIKFRITYVPQCAVTQQGNVIGGTLWNVVPASDNFQQTLRTSPGGILTQCYKSIAKNVRMKSNLQFNLFRCSGEFNQESNPFIFIAIAVACINKEGNRIIPGYFYVDYVYTFKNPIGLSHVFYNSGLTTYEEINTSRDNTALISCSTINSNNMNLTMGTLLQTDRIDNNFITTYNNQPLTLQPNSPVWCFSSSSIKSGESGTGETVINEIEYNESVNIHVQTGFLFGRRTVYYLVDPETDELKWVFLNPTSTSHEWTAGDSTSFPNVVDKDYKAYKVFMPEDLVNTAISQLKGMDLLVVANTGSMTGVRIDGTSFENVEVHFSPEGNNIDKKEDIIKLKKF